MEAVMKLDIPVKFVNWPDAQAAAKAGHNILIFPYSRTAEREPNFMWVQKLWDIEELFVTRAGAAPVNSYDQGRSVPSIGVVAGSTGHAELTKRGFDKLKLYANAVAVTEAVAKGDVDAAYSAGLELQYAWKQARYPGDIVLGKSLAERALYIAASRDSPEMIKISKQDWMQAYETLLRDGSIHRVYESYFGKR
jgi:polar amino acid transport system substrate-binding protein